MLFNHGDQNVSVTVLALQHVLQM